MAFLAKDSRPRVTGAGRHDPIRVTAKEHGYFPKSFVWRGQRHDVQAVERCWTIQGRTLGRIEQHCFRVRCEDGTYQLVQDLKRNAWFIERGRVAR